MEKVLVIVGDASETVDTLYPYYRLIEGGFQPVVAGPEVHRYQMVMHEVKPGWTITKEWEGYTIQTDIAFRDVKPEEYAGIFFSGGRAPEYIRYDEDLVRITRHFFDAEQADRLRLPRRRDSRLRRLRQGTPHGHGAEVQVRPGSLRRHVRRRAVRDRRQPGQRPNLPRPRPLHRPLDQAAGGSSRLSDLRSGSTEGGHGDVTQPVGCQFSQSWRPVLAGMKQSPARLFSVARASGWYGVLPDVREEQQCNCCPNLPFHFGKFLFGRPYSTSRVTKRGSAPSLGGAWARRPSARQENCEAFFSRGWFHSPIVGLT